MAASAARRRKDAPPARPKSEMAPRTTARVPTRASSDRRANILEVATRRFAEHGFENTTVRQIGDDVNILSGSLYHHFATKEEMLHEIVREPVQQMRNNTLRVSRASVDPERRLIALILLDLGELTRNQKVHAILTNERRFFRQREEFAYVTKAKRETYQAWRSVFEDGIESRLFRADVDIFLTIMTIIRMLNTAADWYRNDDAHGGGNASSYSLDKVIDFHLQFVLSAIRTPERESEPIPRKECEELACFRGAQA
jgi:AcrR family transcriptional regulator